MAVITEDLVREALMEVYDPEIGINIVDLGLVYELEVQEQKVDVVMTLTTPMCPLSEYIDSAVRDALKPFEIKEINVKLVWTPPWNPSMMSEDAKLELGFW